MTLLESLQNHTTACEETYRVMLDLNRSLKSGAKATDPAMLDRQRATLATLESSLTQLRSAAVSAAGKSPEVRGTMEKCQRTILKALLLDRENEQLLLKAAMVRPPAAVAPKPAPASVARAYGKFR